MQAEPVPDGTRGVAIPAELPTPVRSAMARTDLATRALPREQQQDVLELAEEIYWAGRSQAATDVRQAVDWYPEDVFPADSENRSAIAGTAMRHAYEQAAQIAEGGHRD